MKTLENTCLLTLSISTDFGNVQIDLARLVTLYWIEDIYSYSKVGKLVFNDTAGILEFGPFTGNETISISYGEEEDKQETFFIYKVSRMTQSNNVASGVFQMMEVFFCDSIFQQLVNTQYSRSWSQTTISSIINHIYTKALGVPKWKEFEESINKIDYCMPFWHINTTLGWLLKRGIGKHSGVPGYLLFHNGLGFNLLTLDTLLSKTRLMRISEKDDGLYKFDDLNQYLYNKILGWSLSGIDFSHIKTLSGGVRYGYDSLTKAFIKNEYNYKDVLMDHTILGTKTLFPDISDKNVSNILTGEHDTNVIDIIYKDEWIKKYALQNCINITVRGHEARYAGGLIEIQWPSKDDTQFFNKNLSGKFLVKSITHHFSSKRNPLYMQKMVLIKNGYDESDFRDLLSATKTN